MSNKEIESYLKILDEGLGEAEKIMLQEKASRGETVVNSKEDGTIVYIPAKDIIQPTLNSNKNITSQKQRNNHARGL